MGTCDIGRMYITISRTGKQFDRADSYETEAPYRIGRGIAVRVFPGWAIVFGRWHLPDNITADEGVRRSIGASDLDVTAEEIRSW